MGGHFSIFKIFTCRLHVWNPNFLHFPGGVVEAGLYGVCMVFYGAVTTNLYDLTTVSFVVTAG